MKRTKRPKRHPYRPWLPYPSDVEFPESNPPGQPAVMYLRSFKNDKSMRAQWISSCCDCGLVHMYTYEVFKDPPENEWWMVKRAYRLQNETDLMREKQRYDFVERKKR